MFAFGFPFGQETALGSLEGIVGLVKGGHLRAQLFHQLAIQSILGDQILLQERLAEA